MKSVVVNCSAPYYNLGAQKLRDWLTGMGERAEMVEGDPALLMPDASRVYLSVIFSWHAPIAAQIAIRLKDTAQIECGGPGMFALRSWWKQQTGLDCHAGLDQRFDKMRGKYQMTFASRGCPVNCYFCIVPRIEGTAFTLDWDFVPAPILCDNNLSALPADFQDHIIRRFRETGTVLRDANSGFEPRTFTDDTYNRWRGFYKGAWRFAFDEMREHDDVRRMMSILRDEPASRKRVYVLIGNEPFEQCYERAQKVIEWGGQPYVQPVMPLNALSRDDLKIAYRWTHQRLRDFQRYYNRWLWRKVPITEYSNRKGDKPPFAKAPETVSV